MPPAYQYVPPRNSYCLCGSGLQYKVCCAERLPGTKLMNKRTSKLMSEGKFSQALYSARADIVQYTIWHKSHTEVAVSKGMPKEGGMFQIDLDAMSDLVDRLFWLHIRTERLAEFPAVLERLRDNIKDERWHRKIIYFHAMHALWPDWNEEHGRRELAKLGSVMDEKDVDILQVYLDIFNDQLSFAERQRLIDRILEFSASVSDIVHYKGTKAVQYLMIGEAKTAEELLGEAIEAAKGAKLTLHAKHRLALAYQLLGNLRQDMALLDRSIEQFKEIQSDEDWHDQARFDIRSSIGESFRYKDDWAAAEPYYADLSKESPTSVNTVFLAHCQLQLGKIQEAKEALALVKFDDLEPEEQVDYAFTNCGVSIAVRDRTALEAAATMLRGLRIREPYFRERRDAFLLSVQEAIIKGPTAADTKKATWFLARLKTALSYVQLKPNFMGVGLDVGKILDDKIKQAEARQKQAEPAKKK